MRISDWSSDVCSSDLAAQPHPLHRPRARLFGGRPAEGALSPLPCREGQGRHRAYHDRRLRRGVARQPGDRKSVVSGKRVSVRLDLGGGRIINKKIVYTNSTTIPEFYTTIQ